MPRLNLRLVDHPSVTRPADHRRLSLWRKDSEDIARSKLRQTMRGRNQLDAATDNNIELLQSWIAGLQEEVPPVPVLTRRTDL